MQRAITFSLGAITAGSAAYWITGRDQRIRQQRMDEHVKRLQVECESKVTEANAAAAAATAEAAKKKEKDEIEALVVPQPAGKITAFHHDMVRLGLPSLEHLCFYETYISSANFERRIPNWVFQRLSKSDIATFGDSDNPVQLADRAKSYFNNKTEHVPEMFRAANTDYFHSGWSRGHLVPAGDNRTRGQLAMDQTFLLNSNIVPQNFHNNANFWYRLEVFVKQRLTDGFKNVNVISGPLFLPQDYPPPTEKPANGKEPPIKRFVKHDVIGANGVAVPTHLYKVVLVEPHDADVESQRYSLSALQQKQQQGEGEAAPKDQNATGAQKQKPYLMAAFVVPNEPIPRDKTLQDHLVDVEFVEKHSGLQMFRSVDRQQPGVVLPLCELYDCTMMTEDDLEIYNYPRRIDWARTKEQADAVLADARSKGHEISEKILRAYQKKIQILEQQQQQQQQQPKP